MNYLSNAIRIASVILGLTAPMTSAFADQGNLSPSQLPPLPVLTAEWWQWALSIPNSVNPVADASGDQCMVGQRDPIWLLAGSFGDTPITRTCSVPDDTSFLFRVINNVQFDSPNYCGQDSQSIPLRQLRKDVSSFIDDAYAISVQVDKRFIRKDSIERVQSPVFWTALPADNLFGGGASCPVGIYSPSVSDGYWVVLNPMKAGAHTIHIKAQSISNGEPFTIDVTCNLTVVHVSLK